ncbi:hypothetical protein SAMN05216548_11466 [Faunimonas pinastri]|uniref:Uncharacterized protein n=1 Tax=Faunimonas pinastri TaxID=1855383 RepID=A0A1H9MVX8_9HYPH|nr:hypothetical protein SAMN05216548_11466 [Faunimonas pinastri]
MVDVVLLQLQKRRGLALVAIYLQLEAIREAVSATQFDASAKRWIIHARHGIRESRSRQKSRENGHCDPW